MVKVKVITNSQTNFNRLRTGDILPLQRSNNIMLHPLSQTRDYMRAIVATKMEKIFSKPFLQSLNHHNTGINAIQTSFKNCNRLISGDNEGVVKFFEINKKKLIYSELNHKGGVNGLFQECNGKRFQSQGMDGTIKRQQQAKYVDEIDESGDQNMKNNNSNIKNLDIQICKTPIISGDFQKYPNNSTTFATSSNNKLLIWSVNRTSYISEEEQSSDQIYSIKFNPSETNILAGCGNDRITQLWDLRVSNYTVSKILTKTRNNCLSWNPQQPSNFIAGNEDTNIQTWDIRKIGTNNSITAEQLIPLHIHKGHAGTILTVDQAPHGKEFISGSFDKTIRIFKSNSGRSRDCQQNRRMQIVRSVNYTSDAEFILSGSDDSDIRIWKSLSYKPCKQLNINEKIKFSEREILKTKYNKVGIVNKILRNKHLPKFIQKHSKKIRIMSLAKKRKQQNIIENSALGSVPYISERKNKIIGEIK